MRVRGFTLIELVVTLAILGSLAGAAMPLMQLTEQRSKETDLRQALRMVRTAIDTYKEAADHGRSKMELGASGHPPTLQTLVDGVEDIQSEKKVMIYFFRRWPRDPFFADPRASAGDTWGLRSYASPPAEPQAGDDVFEVYSISTRKGLNGISYRDW